MNRKARLWAAQYIFVPRIRGRALKAASHSGSHFHSNCPKVNMVPNVPPALQNVSAVLAEYSGL